MTYAQDKRPWRIAQRMDLLALHEMVIARAVPKPIPALTAVDE
jgi:hypothetical protein